MSYENINLLLGVLDHHVANVEEQAEAARIIRELLAQLEANRKQNQELMSDNIGLLEKMRKRNNDEECAECGRRHGEEGC